MSIPGSKIGKDVRQSSFLRSTSFDKPGPGNYLTLSFTEIATGTPRYGFGSSQREKDYLRMSKEYETLQLLPGPGNYNIKSPIGVGVPKATMPGRR